jgi:hypothetical protein
VYGAKNAKESTKEITGERKEKELERIIKKKDERIEELTRIIIDSRIISRNA